MEYSDLSNKEIIVNKKCDIFLSNIQSCLHECSDTKRYIEIKDSINVKECVNVYEWMRNIKDSIRLKVDIKNLELKNKYYIDYNVEKRHIIIDKV
jgi:hypothetical protein